MTVSSTEPESCTAPRPEGAGALEALADWPELDAVRGVAMLRGDAAKYLPMLVRLAAKFDASAPLLSRAHGGGDRVEVRRVSHEIYGSAATLGAVRVAAAARDLDLPHLDEVPLPELDLNVGALQDAMRSFGCGLRARLAPAAG